MSGKDLPGNGPARGVHGNAQDELGQVGPLISGVAPLPPVRFRIPIDIEAGGVDEDHIQSLVKEVQIPAKEPAFQVFPHFRQESRGAIEMLQGQPLELRSFHRFDPRRPGEVGTRSAQPLQRHGETDPLYREGKFAVQGQFIQEVRQPLFFPETAKDQRRPPLPGRAGGQPRSPDRFHHPQFLTVFTQTTQQAVQFSGSQQGLFATQTGYHLLPNFAPLPVGPDNLQVLIRYAISVDTPFRSLRLLRTNMA